MAPLVRKQLFINKIKTWPFDVLLWINELRLSIEWDDYAVSLALPLGICLCVVEFILQSILNYYNSISSKSNNVLFNSDYVHYEQLKSNLYNGNLTYSNPTNSSIWVLKVINNGLLIASVIQSFVLFTKYREYGLLYLKKNDLQTPSIFKRSLKVGSLIISRIMSVFTDETLMAENSYDDEVWMLKLWNPLKFSLYLFVGFNPINLGIINTSTITLHLIFVIAIISGQSYIFVYKFLNLLNDKQILNQELLKEYTNKFVKPLTKLKKDVQIDSTQGPYDSTVLVNARPYVFNKLKVFRTHDIHGNEVQEYVKENDDDEEFQSFEEYTSDHIRPQRRNDSFRRFENSFNSSFNSRNRSQTSMFQDRSFPSYARNSLYFDEMSDEDSDSDNWYISSTPYRKRYNPVPTSRSRSPFKSPTLKPHTIFNTNRTSPHPQRIPTLNTTPLLPRSPSRSPQRLSPRSPSRTPSPVRSPARSMSRSSLASSREHTPNRSYMRSPSPNKHHPTPSPRPWR